MFKITGTSVLDGSIFSVVTDDPFGFLADCGWEFETLEGIFET